MYSVTDLFILFILLLLSNLTPMAPLGFITWTADHSYPKTLLAVPDAFPAGLIVCDPTSFIEKKCQFPFSFLAHSRHRHSSFLPPAYAVCRTAKYGHVSVSFFAFFTRLSEPFWPQIFLDRYSTACAKNAVWSCFGIIFEIFIWATSRVRQNANSPEPVPVSFFSWILLSFFLLRSNTTNGEADSPAGIFLLCCVSLSSRC